LKAVLAAAAVSAFPGMASANGVHTHDGFFLRLEPGIGYLKSSASHPGVADFSMSGTATSFSLAIGGALNESLVLAGEMFISSAEDPKFEQGGTKVNTRNTTSSLVGFGPQLTYYVMPTNLYVSGTLAFTRMTSDEDGVEGRSDGGVGGRLALGKEWWVSDNWGLGLAAHLDLSTNKNGEGRVGTWGTGVAFSATYN
jgi:hypothetical protein